MTTATAAITSSTTETVPTSGTGTVTDLPGTGKPSVLLGDMNTPEQFIIGDLYEDALKAEGFTVVTSHNIGPTSVSQSAMSQGSLDVFPEYLNVYDSQIAGDSTQFTRLGQAVAAGRDYAARHGQTLLKPTPFSDTAGVVVLTRYARRHHLRTIGDLRRVQNHLTFGSPYEFSAAADGLPTLEKAYDLRPAVTTQVTIGDQYAALTDNEVQAAYDDTTDSELSQPLFTDLGDPRHELGFGNVVPVVASSFLASEGPVFAETLNRVDALLSTRAIRGLTAETTGATQPAVAAAEVALEFLQGNGLLPPPSWATVTATTTTPTVTKTMTTTPAAAATQRRASAQGPRRASA